MLVLSSPPLGLARFVDLLWIDARPAPARPWRIVADDAPHLLYHRSVDAEWRVVAHRLHLVGPRSGYADIDRSRRTFTVGARLRAGVIPALFGLAAHELTDRTARAEHLVRGPAQHALFRLERASARDAVHELATFVAELAARGRAVDPRARRLEHARHVTVRSVREIAGQLGLGDRGVRAWSSVHLGLGARRWLSIRRLHRALEMRLAHPLVPWGRVAALCGFADQSHLVRESRALLGESPSAFVSRAAE